MNKINPLQYPGEVDKKTLKKAALKIKNVRRISELSQDLQYEKPIEEFTLPEKEKPKESKIRRLIRILTTNPPVWEDKTLKEMAAKMKPVEKARDICPLHCLQKTKEQSIYNKVRLRHLELEPLCCCSSCVVRGGCGAVIAGEALYIVITTIICFLKLYDNGKMTLWRGLQPSFYSLVTHPAAYYVQLLYNITSTWMVYIFLKGVIKFDRLYVKLHWQYDFFALGYNCLAFAVHGSQHYISYDLSSLVLTACFALQIPLQLWAISIVKECFHFFNMLYVLIMIAEP
ncbi:unnamed protein product [Bursaphelenchus xylophilus]|uniref:(pine wood nematode) hypothetical protein n=1 Tax=Bursaphelenchus xylophilus TaxID=6326 RepID=A0A1I7SQY2_BURXY|nr:unnamed protein product [Bursaphelenchus xylophilus]CAG9110556.1 unnamed protein product [Bursaphelenchus xylophilus]